MEKDLPEIETFNGPIKSFIKKTNKVEMKTLKTGPLYSKRKMYYNKNTKSTLIIMIIYNQVTHSLMPFTPKWHVGQQYVPSTSVGPLP